MSKYDHSDISCPICLDIYDLPKNLNCGHSFCEHCVLQIINRGQVTCPECRKPTVIPPDGLATNFALNRMPEQLSGINLVTIVESQMSAEMESTAKRVARKVVNEDNNATEQQPNKYAVMAGKIVDRFGGKYGRYWHCTVRTKDCKSSGFSFTSKENHYIELEAQDVRIFLYKSEQDEPCWKCGDNLCESDSCKLEAVEIMEQKGCTTDVEMIAEAKQTALQAIKEGDDYYEIGKFIKDRFDRKYGTHWICIVGTTGAFDEMSNYQRGFYITLNVGALRLSLFKP